MNSHSASLSVFRARGFTLIEILVVVTILGILAAIVVPQFINRIDDAQITKAKADIRALESALELYRIDNYSYPSTDQGLEALVKQPSDPSIRNWRKGGYLKKQVTKDPWGNDYQYVSPGTHNEDYDLFTLGKDHQDGGEGINADIGNWDQE